jgi:hypothetical protein
MKFRIATLLLLLFIASVASATPPSLTVVTVTLTDSTGQIWTNAQWQANFVQPFGNPAKPNNNGNPITPNHSGVADNTGTFVVSLDDNFVVAPGGSQWQFILCPNATVQSCTVANVTVHGATQNLSASLSSYLISPSVNTAPTIARAYKDSEALGGFGALYVNTTDNTMRQCLLAICTGTGWQIVIVSTVNPVFTGTLTVPCIKFNFDASNDSTLCSQGGTGHINFLLPSVGGTLAGLNSPVFTGSPMAPTPATGDSSTSLATTAFVKNQNYITASSAPVSSVFGRTGAVVAVTNDYSVAQVNGAAPLASPAFTGVPTAPTNGSPSDSSTQLATDSFVQSAISNSAFKGVIASSITQLGSPVNFGNSATTIITHTTTMPSSGCPCRAFVSYGLMLGSANSGIDAAFVTDGTTPVATAQTATPGSATNFGLNGSSYTAITYANNAAIPFTLKAASTHSGGTTAATSLGPSLAGGQATWLQITIFTSN